MKTLILLFVLAPFFTFSQNEASYVLHRNEDSQFYYFFPQSEMYDSEFIKSRSIRTFSQTSKNKKGELVLQKIDFDEKGVITSISHVKDTMVMFYNSDSMLEKVIVKGKEPREVSYTYVNGLEVSKRTVKNDELVSILITQYDDQARVLFTSLQNGKKLKDNYLLNYSYNRGKLQAQTFFKNGKLSNQWDYTCSDEGKEKKKEKTIQFCEYIEESNDASYIIYKRRLYENKKSQHISLSKYFYTKDSVLYKFQRLGRDNKIYKEIVYQAHSTNEKEFDHKGRLTKSRIHKKANEIYSVVEKRFNSKGTVIYTKTTIRENDNKLKTSITNRGKRQNRPYTYTTRYDENGLVTQSANKNKEKITQFLTYEYLYY